jgi:hypothetical protein
MANGLQAVVWVTPHGFPGMPCGHDHVTHTAASVCGEKTIAAARQAADYPSGGSGYWVTSDLGISDDRACDVEVRESVKRGDYQSAMSEIMRAQLVKWRMGK